MNTYVRADGLSVGGISVGASNAILNFEGTVATEVGTGAQIQVGKLKMYALQNVTEDLQNITGNSQYADVFAGASGYTDVIENLAQVNSKQTVSTTFNGDLLTGDADLRAMGYYASRSKSESKSGQR